MKKKTITLTLTSILLCGCTQQIDNKQDITIIAGTISIQNQDKYVIYQDKNSNKTTKEKIPSDILVFDSNATYTIDVLTNNEPVLLSLINNKIIVIQINNE